MEFLTHIPAGGTLFNTGAILVGGTLGLVVGRLIPQKLYLIIFQCFGLFCLSLGFSMAQRAQDVLIVLFSLLFGAVVGECLDLDGKLTQLGEYLKKKLNAGAGNFTQAFVTATLLFCVGSMSILGAIQDGLGETPTLLITKGVMDGTSSILLAASMGVGTLCSALPLLLYQGTITFAASWANAFITPAMLDNLSGVGGLVFLAIGLNLMKVTDVKTSNLLPGIFFALLISAFF